MKTYQPLIFFTTFIVQTYNTIKIMKSNRNLTFATSILFCSFFIFFCNQKEIELQNNLVGTWQLVTNNQNQEINEQTHSNFRELKTITNETFSVIDIIPKDSIFVGVFYGNYKITPKIYSETITYTNRNGVRMLNKVNKFNYKLENDTWTIEGIDNPYHQTWKKIKN